MKNKDFISRAAIGAAFAFTIGLILSYGAPRDSIRALTWALVLGAWIPQVIARYAKRPFAVDCTRERQVSAVAFNLFSMWMAAWALPAAFIVVGTPTQILALIVGACGFGTALGIVREWDKPNIEQQGRRT